MSSPLESDESLEARTILPLVLLCTLIVVVVSGASFLTYWKGSQALQERGESQFTYELSTLRFEAEAALAGWVSELELWASQPSMIRVLDQDVDNEIGESLEAAAQHSEHLRTLTCFSTDGRLVAYARSREAARDHAPLDEESRRRYLDGRRADVTLAEDGVSLRVPIFLEFGDRQVMGTLEAELDGRALLPHAPLSWVTLRDESGTSIAQRTPGADAPFRDAPFQNPGAADSTDDDWIRRTIPVALPDGVVGPSLSMELRKRRESLFGQIPVLRTLVIALSVCSSVLLLSMLAAFLTQERRLMRRLAQRAVRLEELNTELKRSRLELRDESMRAEAANRAKGDFLAHMSHEIRTPLNGVIGASSALAEMELSQEGHELTGIIGSSGELLLALIEDILDFSRIEAGKLELDETTFELRALVESTLQLAGSASKSGVELSFSPRDDVPRLVRGDPTRLRQILVNLLGNAVKFTDKGEIHVDLRLEQRTGSELVLRFAVSDTGQGIPPHALTRIFESFTQAKRSGAHQHEGTGLGLAICKRLVEAMGGNLEVTSELGVGSTFEFSARFRIVEDQEPAHATPAPQDAAPTRPPPLPRSRVLLAEDRLANQRVATILLQRLGCDVDVVAHGAAALEAAARTRYDLILMDCLMPVMDGFEATRRIREQESEHERSIIVALTASAMPSDHARCIAAGMDGVVTKPLRIESLEQALRRWLLPEKGES